jgi:ParB family chromosome partitioning protein
VELKHIPLDQLHVAAINMRHARKAPDISDILPSVRARGILQPLLVRPNAEGFEIVAGRRRYFSAKAVEVEQGSFAPVPCAVMQPGDDAAALEASLIENIARLDPDEIAQYETFARLAKEGRAVSEIAATFGVTERQVKGRLALGNLLPKIKDAYRDEQIDAETIRHLTMATKAQQKEWLALYESHEGNAPFGRGLKQWLFGGQSISTKVALFPLDTYRGHTVSDLFEDESYFADPDLFWELQNAAIEMKAQAYREAGWKEVVVLAPGEQFAQWDHEKLPKTKGGKVFITVSPRGDVESHEGWASRKDARKAARDGSDNGGGGETPKRPEGKPQMTQAMENYLELHRHSVVRLALLRDPSVAFRLMVAHVIAPTGNWQVAPDGLRARSKEIEASIRQSPAFVQFEAEYKAVVGLLNVPKEADTVVIFARLLTMRDAEVVRVAAFAMALTLKVGDDTVEAAGVHLNANASEVWQPDEAFFELIRDRTTVNAMLAELAGKAVAKSNLAEKGKIQKQIVRDFLRGENGRAKVENWLPGWMQFPFKSYGKGACRISVAAKAAAKSLSAV